MIFIPFNNVILLFKENNLTTVTYWVKKAPVLIRNSALKKKHENGYKNGTSCLNKKLLITDYIS